MNKKSTEELIRNWSIKKKLLVSHGSIIVTTFVLIVFLLIGMKSIENSLRKLYEGPTMNIHYSAELYYPQLDIQRAVNRVMAEGIENLDTMYPQLENTVNKNMEIIEESYALLYETLLTQENKDRLTLINSKLQNEIASYRTEVMRLLKQGDFTGAREYNNTYYKPAVDEVKGMIEELEASVMETAANYEKNSETTALILIIAGLILLILVTWAAITIALRVTDGITAPIKQIEDVAKMMRVGNLSASQQITYQSKDELGTLAQTMRETLEILDSYVKEISGELSEMAKGDLTKNYNEITDFLGDFASIKQSFGLILKEFNETLSRIKATSAQVDSDSDEIAHTANELSDGNGEQASAMEQLTATINSVSQMAADSAKQAETAYDNTLKSVQVAEDERKQMKELQAEMQRIKEISGEIEAIITTIEEIASQTGLLALNASIEAARAGEAGKGFTVVADQIGKLATDSAQAVVNTKALIDKTVEEIDKGNKITERTAVAFEDIITEMQGFAAVVKEVNENAGNQAMALTQVEAGIEQIASVTQQNAAASQQCSAISMELAARASELDDLINQFKLYKS